MARITCPWCGTHYQTFQNRCDQCGGSLPLPEPEAAAPPAQVPKNRLIQPPSAPRSVPDSHVWKLLSTGVAPWLGGIFGLLGVIFGVVGFVLSITIVAAFVGLPFVILGVLFLAVGASLFLISFGRARNTLDVIRQGSPVLGKITQVTQNFAVSINGRHPWTIRYQFEIDGHPYSGIHTTLAIPNLSRGHDQPVYVLYDPQNPENHTIYPNPYGYYLMD